MLLSAKACLAQQYSITDLGTLAGGDYSTATGINASGQVIGWATANGDPEDDLAFRTAANRPINPATDGLGTFGGPGIFGLPESFAYGINASGQVVGWSYTADGMHAFRTAANSPINPATDDLGTFGGLQSVAYGINASGQVVGCSTITDNTTWHAFRTAANRPINPVTDDMGGGCGLGINASGQVIGTAVLGGAFRTAPNSPINPATDFLGTLGGTRTAAAGINDSGQVVGSSNVTGDATWHAFRTAANSPINPATDDLGTLGGLYSEAEGINASGQVVGFSKVAGDPWLPQHAFVYLGGKMYDLNDLIPAGSGWELFSANGINDAGQIVGQGTHNFGYRAFLLTPNHPYKAFVQPPINSDGSSIFKASRGVIPVKFTLTKNDSPTCDLPSAMISVTRTAGGTIGSVDGGRYIMAADSGSSFRIDPAACEYIYNLATRALGIGAYRVDISINGYVVGSAVFELE
jgi:probable HAF family extracellular repeat protein